MSNLVIGGLAVLVLLQAVHISEVESLKKSSNKKVTPYKTRKGVVKNTITAGNSKEDEGKCHVRARWDSIIPDYKLSCMACGNQYVALVYYGPNVLGGAVVTGCGTWGLPRSISILPEGAFNGVKSHFVQFDKENKDCDKVQYRSNPITRIYDQTRDKCVSTSRHRMKYFNLTVNGWKKGKTSKGIVRQLIDANTAPEIGCTRLMTWKNKVTNIKMKCYDCGDHYVAMVLLKLMDVAEVWMAAITVDTCVSPFLESSVTVVPPKTKDDKEFQIQYILKRTDSCTSGIYKLENGLWRETQKPGCSYNAGYHYTTVLGYKNGWKKEVKGLRTKSV